MSKLVVSLVLALMAKCLYRFHEGRNASEESVERYPYAVDYLHVE